MKITQNLIPVDGIKRSAMKMNWEYITVHNTGNPKSTAENERAWLTNTTNNRQASWHYVVCEDTIIQAIPDNEVAWHAGDGNGNGNMKSIGIEICESGDFEKSKRTAVKLIVKLLKEKNKGPEFIKRHFDWSGKNCPRLLIPIWPQFMEMIRRELIEMDKPNVPDWKLDGLKQLHKQGLVSDYDGWVNKIDDPMPAWAVFNLLTRIGGVK
jgi:N-acetylmuramoyl-L-alanine amidase